jgi:hypothetical protein
MKRNWEKRAFVAAVLWWALIFTACDPDDSGDTGTPPEITDVFIAKSEADCLKEREATSFSAGDEVWVGIVVTDPDQDVSSATLTVKKTGSKNETKTFAASDMPFPNSVYAAPGGTFPSGASPAWSVTVYVRDRGGNKSNVMTYSW